MALSPLTISLTSGVLGKPFLTAVSGQTAGSIVEVANGGTPGFGYSNGKLSHSVLPLDTNLVILRERLPLTGESLLTNFIITAASNYAVRQQALGINPSLKSFRVAPVTQGDGSLLWTLYVEDSAGATTSATIGATAPTLGALTLSGSLQIGTATSGTIIGATAGSTITGNIPGITINSAARTYSGTPTGSAGTISNGLVETLAGATNTPNNSAVTVAAAAITLGALSLFPLEAVTGNSYSGTIAGVTSGSTVGATSSDGTTLTVSGTGTTRTVTGSFSGAGSPTITLTETLAGATNTPRTTTPTMLVSAPATIPNAGSRVAAWYAEDLVTAGLANNATVGTPGVSEWIDRINGISAVIGGGTPKLKTAVENGLPSVLFSAAYLTAGQNATLMATINSKTYTIYAVLRNLLTASTASICCTSGTTKLFFACDGVSIGQDYKVPMTPALGTSLFSAGLRGSATGAAYGRSPGYQRTIVNGTAVHGGTLIPKDATVGSDFFIGGQAGATGKYELLELHVYSTDQTNADDMQFHKYVCDKYNKTRTWLLSPLSYIPVLAGDSITNGVLADTWPVGTVGLFAASMGLSYGQYINVSTAAINIADLLSNDTVTLSGLPGKTTMPMKIHEFEWVNSKTAGVSAATAATQQQSVCALYKSYGFSKVILGTTLDYGNRTNSGAQSKSAFCAALAALPAGTYDYLNPLHLDATIGVDGTAPNSGSNVVFADSISHPTGHANFPTVQSGYPYLVAMVVAGFAAV